MKTPRSEELEAENQKLKERIVELGTALLTATKLLYEAEVSVDIEFGGYGGVSPKPIEEHDTTKSFIGVLKPRLTPEEAASINRTLRQAWPDLTGR